jgi:hypothetical protein
MLPKPLNLFFNSSMAVDSDEVIISKGMAQNGL